jgi:gas vesicle protein
MDKTLSQLLIGAILGAVAIEVLREKRPEVFNEIKHNAKEIAKDFKSVCNTIRTAAEEWSQDPS